MPDDGVLECNCTIVNGVPVWTDQHGHNVTTLVWSLNEQNHFEPAIDGQEYVEITVVNLGLEGSSASRANGMRPPRKRSSGKRSSGKRSPGKRSPGKRSPGKRSPRKRSTAKRRRR